MLGRWHSNRPYEFALNAASRQNALRAETLRESHEMQRI